LSQEGLEQASRGTRWVPIPERCGYVMARLGTRELLMLLMVSEIGVPHLKVAGLYSDEWKLVGENREILMFKVEDLNDPIDETFRERIRQGLPEDLRGLRISG
jgi:hypothetical protein